MPLFLVSVEGKFHYTAEGSFAIEAATLDEARIAGEKALQNGTADVTWDQDRIPEDIANSPPVVTEVEILAEGTEDIKERF